MPRRHSGQKMKTLSQSKTEKLPGEVIEELCVNWYYLDPVTHEVIPWAEHFSNHVDYLEWVNASECQLFSTTIGLARVSTVFLGLDHGWDGRLAVFETLVFGGKNDGDMRRYSTYDEAKVGHEDMVKRQPSGLTRKQLEDGADLIRKLME